MKVRIDRIRSGAFFPNTRQLLRNMSYLPQDKCDELVQGLISNIPITITLRGPFAGQDWDAFKQTFVFMQLPQGKPGTAKSFIAPNDDEWSNVELPEEDPTAMLLFCIKTEARSGNKYEILVLATTKEIALEHAVSDPAVVKSCDIVPGPFTNGTVLATKLIGTG